MNKEECAEKVAAILDEKIRLVKYHSERIMQQFANELLKLNNEYNKTLTKS